MRYIILGTAGHIDHGKSALVKALTGIEPDRLKEEKERGITIDLGFAFLNYPPGGETSPPGSGTRLAARHAGLEGLNVGIVDVPGHERLIKNMLAGAGGVDLVLLVIAADEGVMPQSKEHLAICNLLRIKKGLIAITKSDLADKDLIALVRDDIKNLVKGTFLENADIVTVSSKTGDNLDVLKDKIKEASSNIKPKPEKGIFRLFVDRVFTLKGFGTVITGTAVSGSISVNEPVEIIPKGIKTKIRGLQSHGESLKTAYAGQRVAINLQGIEREEIRRGDVLTIPGKIKATFTADASIEILKDSSMQILKNRSLIHFHSGTSELIGRIILYDRKDIKPGDIAYCQFRFQNPVSLMAGDRFIIRRFSPLVTIGGGEILDPSPRRVKRKGVYSGKIDLGADLKIFEHGSLEEKVLVKMLHSDIKGITHKSIEGWVQTELPEIANAVNKLLQENRAILIDNKLIHKDVFDSFSKQVQSTVESFHKDNMLKAGMPKEVLRALFRQLDQKFFESLLSKVKGIAVEKEIIRLKTFKIFLSDDKKLLKGKILRILESAAFQPQIKQELAKAVAISSKELDELLKIMVSDGNLVRINDILYLPLSSYKKMMKGLKDFFREKPEMTVGEFRDILSTSRKYALPFLEYLDSNRITLRVGDVRKLLIK